MLEAQSGSAFHPPGLPLAATLTDAVVHGADIRCARGDGHRDWAEPERLRPVLDFVVSTRACFGFVPPGRLRGLRLLAQDQPGGRTGPAEVAGPRLALAVAVLGRDVAIPRLRGTGAEVLAERTAAGLGQQDGAVPPAAEG